jgi:hypothetical protein
MDARGEERLFFLGRRNTDYRDCPSSRVARTIEIESYQPNYQCGRNC